MDELERIKAEIERMMEEEMSFFNEAVSNGEAEISASPVVYTRLQMLLSFIDSLPAEPVKKSQKILHDSKTCKENDDSLTYSESEDLEKEIQRHLKDCLDIKFPTTDIESTKKDVEFTARYFAKWQKEQFEKNRLAACDAQTKEEAEREMDFVEKMIKEEHRQPTYSDAIEYGIRLQKEKEDDALVIANMAGVEEGKQMMKEKMMKDAVDAYIGDDLGVGKSLRLDTDALMRAWIKYEVGTKLKVIIVKED